MKLTNDDRALIEHALDTMAVAMYGDHTARFDALLLYEKAVAIVRERPANARRVRKDFNRARRNSKQMEIPS